MIEILNDSCLDVMDKMIAENIKVDAIITDPPYQIDNIVASDGSKSSRLSKNININLGGLGKAKIVKGFDYERVFKQWEQLQNNINICVFCNKKQIPIYINHYVNKKKCVFNILF